MTTANLVDGKKHTSDTRPRCRSCVSDGAVRSQSESSAEQEQTISETEEEIEKLIEELKEEDPDFEVPEGVWAY